SLSVGRTISTVSPAEALSGKVLDPNINVVTAKQRTAMTNDEMCLERQFLIGVRHSSFLLLADQPPVFFHQINVGCGQPGRNADLAARDALVDSKSCNEAPIDEDKKETAATLHT